MVAILGALITTTGAVTSRVTLIPLAVVLFPAKSEMVAVKVCAPSERLVVFTLIDAKVVPLQVAVPLAEPSILIVTV